MTTELRCPLTPFRHEEKKNAFSNVGQSVPFAGGLVVGGLGLGDTNRRMTSGHCGLGCGWRCGGAALIETGLEGMGVARRHVVTSSSNAVMIITQPQNFLPSDSQILKLH